MRKITALFLLVTLTPTLALAQNVGQCGWGSKLFDGEKGIAPQVLAVTTNGTSGNQTFAISSGTSGCTQSGVVRSSWRTAAFVGDNMTKLASDISRGQGEALDTLAYLLDVEKTHNVTFKNTLKENFAQIFTSDSVSSEQVLQNLQAVLANNNALKAYSARV